MSYSELRFIFAKCLVFIFPIDVVLVLSTIKFHIFSLLIVYAFSALGVYLNKTEQLSSYCLYCNNDALIPHILVGI